MATVELALASSVVRAAVVDLFAAVSKVVRRDTVEFLAAVSSVVRAAVVLVVDFSNVESIATVEYAVVAAGPEIAVLD